jgi:hypothetical protein
MGKVAQIMARHTIYYPHSWVLPEDGVLQKVESGGKEIESGK